MKAYNSAYQRHVEVVDSVNLAAVNSEAIMDLVINIAASGAVAFGGLALSSLSVAYQSLQSATQILYESTTGGVLGTLLSSDTPNLLSVVRGENAEAHHWKLIADLRNKALDLAENIFTVEKIEELSKAMEFDSKNTINGLSLSRFSNLKSFYKGSEEFQELISLDPLQHFVGVGDKQLKILNTLSASLTGSANSEDLEQDLEKQIWIKWIAQQGHTDFEEEVVPCPEGEWDYCRKVTLEYEQLKNVGLMQHLANLGVLEDLDLKSFDGSNLIACGREEMENWTGYAGLSEGCLLNVDLLAQSNTNTEIRQRAKHKADLSLNIGKQGKIVQTAQGIRVEIIKDNNITQYPLIDSTNYSEGQQVYVEGIKQIGHSTECQGCTNGVTTFVFIVRSIEL